MINVKAGEQLAVVATADPATTLNVARTTDVVDMSKFHQVLFIAMLGDMPAETIDFEVQSCDSDGLNAVTLKAATQRAANAANNDGKQIVISIRAEEVRAVNKRHCRGRIVTGGAVGGPAAVIGIGMNARNEPATDNDLADVVEIKL